MINTTPVKTKRLSFIIKVLSQQGIVLFDRENLHQRNLNNYIEE